LAHYHSGKLLRLIVVGINSFKDINGNNATPHIVFQFQNIPVEWRMDSTATNAGGYTASEMREYLSPVSGKDGSGKFLDGLKETGVHEAVLWTPRRAMATGNTGDAVTQIEDMLWLPTERGMFGSQFSSHTIYETEENQGRLEYYDSDERCIKYTSDDSARNYWGASPYYSTNFSFCTVNDSGVAGIYGASYVSGVAPAFSVKWRRLAQRFALSLGVSGQELRSCLS
jgi:hypothetical protein